MSPGVVSGCMPYRDDEHALQAKKVELEQERARIEEHKRALANLNEDEARIHRELADVDRRLAKRKKSLPVLGEVRIASPCHADWNSMTGDEQSRFCDKCAKNVYNLSAMTTEQAESLIREKEGDLCVRYYQRADGTVLTADCPVGVRRKRVRAVAFMAGLGAAAGLGIHAYANQVMMGEMDVAGTRMGKLEVFDGEMMEQEATPAIQGALTPAHFEELETAQKTPVNPAPKKIESSRPTRR
jgi:hypothetical protein